MGDDSTSNTQSRRESKERIVVTILVDEASKDLFVMAKTSIPPIVESG
jgi:hypothetical protein